MNCYLQHITFVCNLQEKALAQSNNTIVQNVASPYIQMILAESYWGIACKIPINNRYRDVAAWDSNDCYTALFLGGVPRRKAG